MTINPKILEHEAIQRMNRRAKKPSVLTYRKQVAMLDDIFRELVPYILDGFILKAPHKIGEFCLGVSRNYVFTRPRDLNHKFDWAKTHKDEYGQYHLRTISKEQYYLFWTPGDRKEVMGLFFLSSPAFNQKLHKRLIEGGKVFAYSKDYPGLVKELDERRFFKYRRRKTNYRRRKYGRYFRFAEQ